MKLKELLEKRAALLASLETAADNAAIDNIELQLRKLDIQIAEAQTAERTAEAEAEERAAREGRNPMPKTDPHRKGILFPQGDPTLDKDEESPAEKRGQDLKDGKKVVFEARAASSTATISSDTALHGGAASEIVAPFEQVGTIDGLIDSDEIGGGDSYKVPFEKSWGEGGITDEGTEYTDADPEFGYATINRVKITAYAEISEEAQKLPNADYESRVRAAVVGAVRRKIISQIFRGNGTKSFMGIFHTPSDIADPEKCLKTIPEIDDTTLDEIIYDYGGDENVEDSTVLMMNKLTLKEFAKVRRNGKKVYDIVIRGNTGTINLMPFVLTSRIPSFATAAADTPWLVYGKLKGYKVTFFSDFDVQRSTDYKFKEGMTAYKVSVMAGGSTVMYNGFLSVIKGDEVDLETPETPEG